MKTFGIIPRNEKRTSGYTLLEVLLMLLATMILAIGVYYFYQGYARNSRNTKRVGDMKFIETAIGIKQGQGVSLVSLVGVNVLQIPDATLGGAIITSESDRYKAGKIDSEAIGVNEGFLKDPLVGNYQLGVTTIGGERYQIASIKEDGGELYGYTYGSFTPRARDNIIEGDSVGTTLVLNSMTTQFHAGDVVEDQYGFTGRILKLTDDKKSLTFDAPIIFSGTHLKLHLWLDETPGLLFGKDKAGLPGIVINGGNFYPFEPPNRRNVSDTDLNSHSLGIQ